MQAGLVQASHQHLRTQRLNPSTISSKRTSSTPSSANVLQPQIKHGTYPTGSEDSEGEKGFSDSAPRQELSATHGTAPWRPGSV